MMWTGIECLERRRARRRPEGPAPTMMTFLKGREVGEVVSAIVRVNCERVCDVESRRMRGCNPSY